MFGYPVLNAYVGQYDKFQKPFSEDYVYKIRNQVLLDIQEKFSASSAKKKKKGQA